MKILITGHLGFIGSHVYKRLSKIYDCIGFDIKQSLVIPSYQDIDLIIHIGATSSTSASIIDPLSAYFYNTTGTFNICELARDNNAKVLYISTCKAKDARTPYGLTKYMGELLVQEWEKTYNVPYIIHRLGTVYGEGQEGSSESGWVSWFLKAKRENKPITIYGDGNQTRDILYITDYVNFIITQVKEFDIYKGKILNIGGGIENEISLLDMLRYIKYDNYTFDKERMGDERRYVSDNTYFYPVTNWQDGLNRLL